MAAKILHSLTDDNPDLQKQIGCMTGIFQLFDRQQMLTGSRRIVTPSPKRLPPGKRSLMLVALFSLLPQMCLWLSLIMFL